VIHGVGKLNPWRARHGESLPRGVKRAQLQVPSQVKVQSVSLTLTLEGLFFGLRAAFRMLHELSVRTTGRGFVFHDYIDDAIDLDSEMSMPAKITFLAEE
jgi:hypothetical protein